MKRVLTLALVCWGALSLVTGIVIALKRSQPYSTVLAELHPCQSQMCLFTITPSQTTLSDAHAALDQTKLFTLADFSTDTSFKRFAPFYRLDLEGESGACSSSAPDCVAQIDLVFSIGQNGVTAGQIVTEFGPPCGISPNFVRGRTALFYPGMVLFFMSYIPQRFHPIMLLGQINIFKNAESCEKIAAQIDDYLPWHGFTIYSKNTVK